MHAVSLTYVKACCRRSPAHLLLFTTRPFAVAATTTPRKARFTGYARVPVVSNLRALDSCREWVRVLVGRRVFGEIHTQDRQARRMGCTFGRSKGSFPTRFAGHEARLGARKGGDCKLAATARTSLRRATFVAHQNCFLAADFPRLLFCSVGQRFSSSG